MVRQGSGWVMEGGDSPYASYAGTPTTGNGFPGSPYSPYASISTPGLHTPVYSPNVPVGTPGSASNFGLGIPSSAFGPSPFPSSPNPGVSSPVPPPMNGRTVSGSSGLSAATPYTPQTGSLLAAQQTSSTPPSAPGTPGLYATFPASPNPNGNGFSMGPPPRRTPSAGAKKDD